MQAASPEKLTRRQSREWALQLLFQLDMNPARETGIDAILDAFWNLQWTTGNDEMRGEPESADDVAPPKARAFAEQLVKGVLQHRAEIDALFPAYVRNWTVNRVGAVERNVLRLAFYEIFHSDGTPPVVVLNEAIDLAKYYSNSESGRFINGVLDRAIKDAPQKKRGTPPPKN